MFLSMVLFCTAFDKLFQAPFSIHTSYVSIRACIPLEMSIRNKFKERNKLIVCDTYVKDVPLTRVLAIVF